MKKLLFAVLTFATLSVQAQEAPKVTSAIIALRGNEIVEAKGFIDEATTIIESKNPAEIKEKILAKYYYNKALIYLQIAGSPDENISGLADNANEIAADNLLKLVSFESSQKKQRFTEEALGQIPSIVQNYGAIAQVYYDNEEFQASYEAYMAAFDFMKNDIFGSAARIDTSLLFNASIVAGNAGNLEESANGFSTCLELGYKGITFEATYTANGSKVRYLRKADMERDISLGIASDPIIGEDQTPKIYVSLVDTYKRAGDTLKFESTLQEARSRFPENKTLLDLELQAYLDNKDFEGALSVLDEAIAKNPGNFLYHYVKGNILQNSGEPDLALVEYNSALDLIDPENKSYSDLVFNTGAIFIDKAIALGKKMNTLGMSSRDQKLFAKYKKERTTLFEESIPYFEKAYELSPADRDIILALMQSYRETSKTEEFLKLKEALEAL